MTEKDFYNIRMALQGEAKAHFTVVFEPLFKCEKFGFVGKRPMNLICTDDDLVLRELQLLIEQLRHADAPNYLFGKLSDLELEIIELNKTVITGNKSVTPPKNTTESRDFESYLSGENTAGVITKLAALEKTNMTPKTIATIMLALQEKRYLTFDSIQGLAEGWYTSYGYRSSKKSLINSLQQHLPKSLTINKSDINVWCDKLT